MQTIFSTTSSVEETNKLPAPSYSGRNLEIWIFSQKLVNYTTVQFKAAKKQLKAIRLAHEHMKEQTREFKKPSKNSIINVSNIELNGKLET